MSDQDHHHSTPEKIVIGLDGNEQDSSVSQSPSEKPESEPEIIPLGKTSIYRSDEHRMIHQVELSASRLHKKEQRIVRAAVEKLIKAEESNNFRLFMNLYNNVTRFIGKALSKEPIPTTQQALPDKAEFPRNDVQFVTPPNPELDAVLESPTSGTEKKFSSETSQYSIQIIENYDEMIIETTRDLQMTDPNQRHAVFDAAFTSWDIEDGYLCIPGNTHYEFDEKGQYDGTSSHGLFLNCEVLALELFIEDACGTLSNEIAEAMRFSSEELEATIALRSVTNYTNQFGPEGVTAYPAHVLTKALELKEKIQPLPEKVSDFSVNLIREILELLVEKGFEFSDQPGMELNSFEFFAEKKDSLEKDEDLQNIDDIVEAWGSDEPDVGLL